MLLWFQGIGLERIQMFSGCTLRSASASLRRTSSGTLAPTGNAFNHTSKPKNSILTHLVTPILAMTRIDNGGG
ncbi:MAG: hypothetical protein ACK5F0_06350, partial [Flavobacteriales bacterium]